MLDLPIITALVYLNQIVLRKMSIASFNILHDPL